VRCFTTDLATSEDLEFLLKHVCLDEGDSLSAVIQITAMVAEQKVG
jgi:hypothetical protein